MTDGCRSENCRKIHELLSEYLDDELKAAVCSEFEKHMQDCPDCRVHVDSVKKVIRLYRDATPNSLPVDIRIRLRDVLQRARGARGSDEGKRTAEGPKREDIG